MRIVVATELAILVAQQAGMAIFLAETIRKSGEPRLTRAAAISYALLAAYFAVAFVEYAFLIPGTANLVVVATPLTICMWWKVPSLIRRLRGDLPRPVSKWTPPDIAFRVASMTVLAVPLLITVIDSAALGADRFLWEGCLLFSVLLAAVRVQWPLRRLPQEAQARVMAGEDP